VIITEEGKSNKPVAFLSMNTDTAVFDHWEKELVENSGKYTIECYCKFNFSEMCSGAWHDAFGGLLLAYELKGGRITEKNTKAAYIGVLHGFAFAEERLDKLGG
jgi:hypothetical protein